MSEVYEAPEWGKAEAVYDEHSLKILGHDVMEDWETAYMHRLAAIATHNGGAILELGYGMGISSTAIESEDIESHTIIEAHPGVMQRCIADNKEAIINGRTRLFSGFWQNVTPLLRSESFDGILFDTYPIKKEEMIGPHMFFFEEAHRLLRLGGILTYYSDEATNISDSHKQRLVAAGFSSEDIDFEICEVSPPEGCEYWQDSTIVVPIIQRAS